MGFFAIGTIDPLYVDRFDGFDLPNTRRLVSILPSEIPSPGPDQTMQQGGTGFRQAMITGTITEPDDLAALRLYDELSTPVTFRDGNGNTTVVVVFELRISDRTELWTFTATLLETTEPAGS